MLAISVSVKGDAQFNRRSANLKRYALIVANAPNTILLKPEHFEAAIKIAQDKYSYPPKPTYPLRWKSRRQQIAVMIKLREEGNLPYRRTNKLAEKWRYVLRRDFALITNEAKDPRTGVYYAPFVIGGFQQPFHADTGWKERSASIEKAIVKPIVEGIKSQAKVELEKSRNA